MPSVRVFVVVLVAVIGSTGAASAAEQYEYPPHRPLRSPWFEGWFTRVTLADWSLAFAIGHLPNQTTSSPPAACLLIVNNASNSTNSTNSTTTPQLYSQFFTGLNISNGRCAGGSKALDGVPRDWRDRNLQENESESESGRDCGEYVAGHVMGDVERDFLLTGANGTVDQWCELSYEGKRLSLHGVYGGVELMVEMEHRGEFTPWAPDHITEGWLPSSATRLHWYVHSLSTPVRVWLSKDPQTRTGSLRDSPSQAGVAHLEKNWGESFPDGWLWAQGHMIEEEDGIQTTQEQAVESYSATTDIKIYGWDSPVLQLLGGTAKRQSGTSSRGEAGHALLSHSVFPAAALEFGGNRRCNQSAST